MQIALIIALSLHILSSVFWAGTSFALARTGGVGGEQLFRPQMGAAVIAVLTGGYLGPPVHEGAFGTPEENLPARAPPPPLPPWRRRRMPRPPTPSCPRAAAPEPPHPSPPP